MKNATSKNFEAFVVIKTSEKLKQNLNISSRKNQTVTTKLQNGKL